MTEPVSRAWEVWAAENLLRGVAREEIVQRLVSEGLAPDEATRLIDALAASPLVEAARPIVRDAKRWQMYAKLRSILARRAVRPNEVLRRAKLDVVELRDVFRAGGVPVVFTDLVGSWRAMEQWVPRRLAERFGDVEIETTVDRNGDATYGQTFRRRTSRMTVRAFVDRMETTASGDFYVVAQNRALEGPLAAMLEDIDVPAGLVDAPLTERSTLWIGPAQTVTTLHHDRTDLLACQVHGRKRWRLIGPTERGLLEHVRGVASIVDPETDPLPGVLVKEVVLAPGDAIFVPIGWWHQVRALDPSVSLSIALDPEGPLEFFRPGEA